VGKHLWFDPKKPMVIAAVVGNVKQYGLDSDTKIAVYFPNGQVADNGMYVVARTAGDPAALANPITAQVHAIEPSAVVYDIHTMDDRLYRSLARQRFASVLLSSFAIFAMILASVSVYGVMSYLVAQNTHEIGIRVALGAQSGSILAMVVKQGLSLAGAGILAGLVGAFGLTRVLEPAIRSERARLGHVQLGGAAARDCRARRDDDSCHSRHEHRSNGRAARRLIESNRFSSWEIDSSLSSCWDLTTVPVVTR
jgi:hypothetical protein